MMDLRWVVAFLLLLCGHFVNANSLNPSSCLDFQIERFEIKQNCTPTDTKRWQGSINYLNNLFRESQQASERTQPTLEFGVFQHLCSAQFTHGNQRQIAAYVSDEYHFVHHTDACTKDGVVVECGERTSSALVSCKPLSGRSSSDIPNGCSVSFTFMKSEEQTTRRKRLTCHCNHLGCGQKILNGFPEDISEDQVRNALNELGCGRVDIVGYRQAQVKVHPDERKTFLMTAERCHIGGSSDCGPDSNPRYLFKPDMWNKSAGYSPHIFPIICVPKSGSPQVLEQNNLEG